MFYTCLTLAISSFMLQRSAKKTAPHLKGTRWLFSHSSVCSSEITHLGCLISRQILYITFSIQENTTGSSLEGFALSLHDNPSKIRGLLGYPVTALKTNSAVSDALVKIQLGQRSFEFGKTETAWFYGALGEIKFFACEIRNGTRLDDIPSSYRWILR